MGLKLFVAAGVGTLLLAGAASAQLMRSGYDQPKFQVVLKNGKFEVRDYGARIIAETHVDSADWERSTSTGFSRLASFIFGENTAQDGESAKIAMTSPVESLPTRDGGYRVVFTMPSDYDLDDLPRPLDGRVELRKVEPARVATLRFAGKARRADLDALEADLKRRVTRAGYRTTSDVTIAQYDPPWVIGPLRRNELMVDVELLPVED